MIGARFHPYPSSIKRWLRHHWRTQRHSRLLGPPNWPQLEPHYSLPRLRISHLNTPSFSQAQENVHGVLPWERSFATENLMNEAIGNETSKSAFTEDYPHTTLDPGISAAELLIQRNTPEKSISAPKQL
ncbi:hypothetical protein AC579_2536 [Pseudocercospora musae]|uniref:Uncharacterized protein n=1 Tax=Pseudocercospora musae TaxID=113226 RepID=A0A139HZW0_9PEZI|nr:hypothetical protein AC579_2536 [Pseudocercospora musae]